MTLKKTLILLLLLGCTTVHGQLQGQPLIDSLLKELVRQREDTNKVKVLNALAAEYAGINPDEGIKYGQLQLDLAMQLGWKKGMAMANGRIAENYSGKSDHSRSLAYDRAAMKIAEETGDKTLTAPAALSIGFDYKNLGDGPKAIEYFLQALKTGEEVGDIHCVANALVQTAGIYWNFGDYAKAVEYDLKALKIFEDAKRNLGPIEHNIGSAYLGEHDYPKAREYLFKSVEAYERAGDTAGAVAPTVSIGHLYKQQKNYTMAITYDLQALKMSEKTRDTSNMSCSLINVGEAYLAIVKDGVAGHREVENASEFGGAGYQPEQFIPTGRAALLKGAIDYIQRGIEEAKKIHSLYILKEAYQTLAEVYKLNGDYKKSLDATDNYHAIKDSLFSQEKGEQIQMLGVKYEYDRRRAADSLTTAGKQQITLIKLQKQKTFTWLGVAGIVLLAGFSFFIVKERGKSEKERKKSDDLLLNILPGEVANELKTNGTTAARHFDNTTVLFTDFVNFTKAGERMSPQGLVDELDICFKAFDDIVGKYNIEKIKTIGDAYLAVCGLPAANADHAVNIIKAAKEINAFMQDRLAKMGMRTFEIRLGIHSGSVVAGIVGKKKFAYDIWGDTVNTAARMEQNSESGRINISETTYKLVQDKFRCEYRGEIEAKGKGKMKMYYIS